LNPSIDLLLHLLTLQLPFKSPIGTVDIPAVDFNSLQVLDVFQSIKNGVFSFISEIGLDLNRLII
jgi:hypothetical protein